jgi:hypothetical protein
LPRSRLREAWTGEERERLKECVNGLLAKLPESERSLLNNKPSGRPKACICWHQMYGGRSFWKIVAGMMPGRSHGACRSYYMDYAAPDLNYSEWTSAERQLLLSCVQSWGCKWSSIAARHFSAHGKRRSAHMLGNEWRRMTAYQRPSRPSRPSRSPHPPHLLHPPHPPHPAPTHLSDRLNIVTAKSAGAAADGAVEARTLRPPGSDKAYYRGFRISYSATAGMPCAISLGTVFERVNRRVLRGAHGAARFAAASSTTPSR